jgi:hypothetical protein
MSAPLRAAQPEISHRGASAQIARDRFEARNRIDGARAGNADAISAVWRAHWAGEIDEAEADRQDRRLRSERPAPPGTLRPAPKMTTRRRRRRPDLAERREDASRQGFSGALPPKIACRFTLSEVAVLNIVADEILKNGACRLAVDKIADRAHVSRRTVQYAFEQARELKLIIIKRRRLTRTLSLPNIVVINPDSPEAKDWRDWLRRRGKWAPAPRSIDWRTLREAVSNKGAKRCGPQVEIYRKLSDQEETSRQLSGVGPPNGRGGGGLAEAAA